MKNENYITIQGWMINELKLSGNELLVYSIIYGFSQDRKNVFSGTSSYIGETLNLSRQSIIDILKKLLSKNFIIKVEKGKYNDYKVNLDVLNNLTQSVKKLDIICKETLQKCVKKLDTHNNIDIYKENNKENGKKSFFENKKEKKETYKKDYVEERIKNFNDLVEKENKKDHPYKDYIEHCIKEKERFEKMLEYINNNNTDEYIIIKD